MTSSGPTRQSVDLHQRRWRKRPVVAFVLRIVVGVLPFAVALGFSVWASRTYPPDRIGLGRVSWVLLVWTTALVVLLAVDRVMRRFLPLVALFKLSLIFPDRAPRRFSVALRTGTTRQLRRRVEAVNADGLSPVEVGGARQLLELVAALGMHDRLTRGHCERVRAYADLIAEELGLDDEDRSRLHWAALLHDVGKLTVPTEILASPKPPTQSEWRILQSHTWNGGELAEPLRPWLGHWLDAVRSHHERWDGGGYPDRLAGTSIPVAARIVAVADAFDVMTSTRSYKKPIPSTEARAEIASCSGFQFDPEVVRAFLNIGIGRLRLVMGPLSWLTTLPGAGTTVTAPAGSISSVVATTGLAVTGMFTAVVSPILEPPPPALASVVTSAPIEEEPPILPTTLSPGTTAPTTDGATTTAPAPVPSSAPPTSTSPADQAPPLAPATTVGLGAPTSPPATTSADIIAANPPTTTTTSTTTTSTTPATTTTTAPTTTTTSAPTTTTTKPIEASPLIGSLRITEYLDRSGNGGVEFVEITNTGSVGVNLKDFSVLDHRPGGPPDANDGDLGENASFAYRFPAGALPSGASVVLWLEGSTMPSDPEIWESYFTPAGTYLESSGDDLWLLDPSGLVVDSTGWYDSRFAGGTAEEWSGAPDPAMGLCPPTPSCRRAADVASAVAGRSWTREGDRFVAAAPTPGAW